MSIIYDQADQADPITQLYAEHMAMLEAKKIPVSEHVRTLAERVSAVVDPLLDYKHPVSTMSGAGLGNLRWKMKLVRRAARGLATDLAWLSELISELKSLQGAVSRLSYYLRLGLEAVAENDLTFASELALLEAEVCPDEQ